MKEKITRRDFLNGIAIGAGGMLLPVQADLIGEQKTLPSYGSSLPASPDVYYPPTLTGMRGSHAGSFEVAHALAWQGQKPDQYTLLHEEYDLVVVGAGMSGLAAAWYYQKKMGPEARILILDNHDDFGGHAKRNEFHYEGKMLLSLGGAQNLDNPNNYSEAAGNLLIDLGIDEAAIAQMAINTPDDYFLGGKPNGGVGLAVPDGDSHRTIGGHWLKFFHGRGNYQAAVDELPVSKSQKKNLIAFFGGEKDCLEEFSLSEKWDYINSTSYNQFLLDRVGLTKSTLPILDAHLLILNGPSGWNHTVLEAILSGCPGVRSMGWIAKFVDSAGSLLLDELVGDVRMFPDGNASVARLLVQKMIPKVAPNMKGIEDGASARFDYRALDQAEQTTRIRLNSTVVGVKEEGNLVRVNYVQHGKALSIKASHCVLACYNNLIPHLCPEMSDLQKEGLAYGERAPFVYANVVLKDGQAFAQLGVTFLQCPYDPFQWVSAAPTVTSGGYQPPTSPADPMIVFMMASPTPADGTNGTTRDLLRIGRHKIYAASFDDYEQEIRKQLQQVLGKHGFNHKTDIKAITVNRIPHGYAYWYQGLDDPAWEEGQAPHEIGRKQFGRISIANSDSEATPLMNAAFDAAHRAVEEQMNA